MCSVGIEPTRHSSKDLKPSSLTTRTKTHVDNVAKHSHYVIYNGDFFILFFGIIYKCADKHQ